MITVLAMVASGIVLWMTALSNRLLDQRDAVRESWSHLATLLRRRHDTVEFLIAEVRTVADFDSATVDAVLEACAAAARALVGVTPTEGIRRAERAESELTEELATLKVALARFPDWHPHRQITLLLQDLTQVEDGATIALHHYNETAFWYNRELDGTLTGILARVVAASPVTLWTDVTRTSSGPAPAIVEHDAPSSPAH